MRIIDYDAYKAEIKDYKTRQRTIVHGALFLWPGTKRNCPAEGEFGFHYSFNSSSPQVHYRRQIFGHPFRCQLLNCLPTMRGRHLAADSKDLLHGVQLMINTSQSSNRQGYCDQSTATEENDAVIVSILLDHVELLGKK